jgi:hypothetical protein
VHVIDRGEILDRERVEPLPGAPEGATISA